MDIPLEVATVALALGLVVALAIFGPWVHRS